MPGNSLSHHDYDYEYVSNERLKETLVGATVSGIFFNQDYLKFETDRGDACFTVYGDCCSVSYFWDFLGVRKLLDNGPILDAYEKELPQPLGSGKYDDCTAAYGFAFVTEDPRFGEVTSLLSFRNDSNGYYGGEMQFIKTLPDYVVLPQLTDDCLEAAL